jgi:transposase
MLTAAHRKKRRTFCQQFRHCKVRDWKRVMFSDESSFRQFNDVKIFVRRPLHSNPLDPRYTKKCVKHAPSVMAWGCFSFRGPASIMFLDKGVTMNAQRYIGVLQHHLLPSMVNHHCSRFQQDSAPCHTARVVKAWFQQKQINVLPWPGNSPDINPIENLWQIVKMKLAALRITSAEHLKQEITRIWNSEVTVSVCENLIASMPSRLNSVIRNHGNPTKY